MDGAPRGCGQDAPRAVRAVKLVIGLGNPGAAYAWTRHNLGFRVADTLARRWRWRWESAPAAWVAAGVRGGREIVLAKPRTYMNRAGVAARELCARYGVDPAALLVVYDDADLPLGVLRLRERGSAGGHRGVASIIEALGTEGFPRLRLGIRGERRQEVELSDYVLEPFPPEEEHVAGRLVELAAEAVETVLGEGFGAAMQRYSGRTVLDGES